MRHGDHACAAFEVPAQQEELIIDFVRGGLGAGEKVWYLGRRGQAQYVLELLFAAGVPIDKPLVRGQLEVFDSDHSPATGPAFDPEGTLAALAAAVDVALSSGYAGMRLMGEPGWAGGAELAGEELESWEASLSDFYAGRRAVGFCQYDRREFDEARLASLLGLHPTVARLPRVSEGGLLRVIDANDRGTELRLAGAADLSSSAVLGDALSEALDIGEDIYIDARRLEFIDLSGVGELIGAALGMPAGRRITVHAPPRTLRRILEVMPGWEELLEVVP